MGITNEEHKIKILRLVKPLKSSDPVKKRRIFFTKNIRKNYSRNRYRRR